MYDYYKERVTTKTEAKLSDEDEASKKLFKSLISIQYFITWAFIPIAYLEKEKRAGKLWCFILVGAMGALEITFIGQILPKTHVFSTTIQSVVPNWLTYREFFSLIQSLIPYLVQLLMVYLDLKVYKTYESSDDQDSDEVRLAAIIEK